MELCLSRRILLILKVNHVQNVCPWPFFAINALGLAIALSTVNHWQAFRLHLLSEAIRCRLSRDEHLRYSLLAQSWQHLVIIEVFEEHRRVHHRDRVDELCKALTELLDDFLPDYVELAVGDLLEGRSFQVHDDADLIHGEAQNCLDNVEFLAPGVLKLAYYEFSDCFWVCLAENLVSFDLASINEEDRTASFVDFVEARWHELSNDIFFAHEVVVKQHVNLVTAAPLDVLSHRCECPSLIEV